MKRNVVQALAILIGFISLVGIVIGCSLMISSSMDAEPHGNVVTPYPTPDPPMGVCVAEYEGMTDVSTPYITDGVVQCRNGTFVSIVPEPHTGPWGA